jgi:purine-binding chemotaxis protein CheW
MALTHDQYLTFLIAGEEFAVGVRHVLEIRPYGGARRVPDTPPWIRGVVERRGAAVPVVDLALRFGSRPTEATHRTCVVLLETHPEGETLVAGLIVDAVQQVVGIATATIRPAPALGPHVSTPYVQGVFDLEGSLVVLLDADRILLAPEIVAAVDVTAPAGAEAAGPHAPASADGAA